MSRLLRLYPAAWRHRYEAEFLDLLAERPPTLRDRLDIARGAIDARLHPQVGPRPPVPVSHRLPGLAALGAGVAWSLAYASALTSPEWGQTPWAWLFPLSLLLGAVSLPSEYLSISARSVAAWMGASAVLTLLVAVTFGEGAPVVVASLGAGLLALAAARSGLGAMGRAGAVGVGIGIPLLVGTIGALGWVATYSPLFLMAIVLPFGLVWIGLGLRMAIRGAPTLRPVSASPTREDVRS